MVALAKTSSIALCARTHTGCAGHHDLRPHDRPAARQTFNRIGPSTASITSRIEAARPRGEIANPPPCPRRDVISPARAKACSTLERKLSGASANRASSGSSIRSPRGAVVRCTITRTP